MEEITRRILKKKNNTNGKNGPFKTLLEQYRYKPPKRGELLEGEVLRVDPDQILIDVGLKRDAIVPRKDLERVDDEDLDDIERGDQVPVKVLRSPTRFFNKLIVSLSRGLEEEDWDRAEQLLEDDETIVVEIIGMNKGGVLVQFGHITGFVPNSHIPGLRRGLSSEKKRAFKQPLLGTKISVVPLEVNRRRGQLVLSGKNAEMKLARKRLKELRIGERIRGKVKHIVDFGAFVDLGGIDGLVHISEIAWHTIEDPAEELSVGDEIEVEVINIDIEHERIGLSRKRVLPSPWETLGERYAIGDLVEGSVTNVVDFGAFVELPDGIEGLIHRSEIGVVGSGSPEAFLKAGDDVIARIVDMDPIAEKISLSIAQVTYDEQLEWMEKHQERRQVDEKDGEEGLEE
jgi:small subunit ribosomal protein S1